MKHFNRTIKTGLVRSNYKTILDSVMGQLSDGMWENSPAMAKYWNNAGISEDAATGEVLIHISDGCFSGFCGKSDDEIKNWFADKVKQIVKAEFDNSSIGWKRNCPEVSDYLSRGYGYLVTIGDAYRAYDILKGRDAAKLSTSAERKEIREQAIAAKKAEVAAARANLERLERELAAL